MPYSAPTFDSDLELYFRQVRHDSVLDIGPGEGKYGRLLRRVQPNVKLIGLEIDASYVEQYRLRDVYDEVWSFDAAELMNHPDRVFDAVIIGDCIEHMRKSIGLDLINFLVYRSKVIAVKFPLQMLQNAWEGHKSEAHVSVWSTHDFRGMDHLFAERDFTCLAMVRGYLNQTKEWIPPDVMRRFGYASMAEFYAGDPSRLALMDAQTRREDLCLAEIDKAIPSGGACILVDELQTRLGGDPHHRSLPFLEKHGEYWGRPADDRQAIDELERMRKSGCTHIVFAWPAMWWLEHYAGLRRHLRSAFRCVVENERIVIFDLRS
jgi:hypothetical protein